MGPGEFAEKITLLAVVVPLSEVSGIRSAKRNLEVGGIAESAHRVNLGRDIVLDDLADLQTLRGFAKRLGIQVVVHDGVIHLEPEAY